MLNFEENIKKMEEHAQDMLRDYLLEDHRILHPKKSSIDSYSQESSIIGGFSQIEPADESKFIAFNKTYNWRQFIKTSKDILPIAANLSFVSFSIFLIKNR